MAEALAAIVGRPNVGKSTLFNRLTETRAAIVHDMPGVTRDRLFGSVEWCGRTFSVVDTGGLVPRSAERFERAIREQVVLALEDADVVLYVADATVGITDLDQEIAAMLRGSAKPVLVAANKADNAARRLEAVEFYGLGLGEVYPVSAINGMGTGEFLDAVVAALPREMADGEADPRARIALVGRPNVGKSLLSNALLGQQRSVVTDIAGTTRDAVDSVLSHAGQEIVLVDTAGLRKRARVTENVEFYATLRTRRAIEACDVAVLLLDAAPGLEAQDIRVLKDAEERGKGLVIAVNKWDLVAKETNTARDVERDIRGRLKTLEHVPVVFVSAKTGQRIRRLLDIALRVVAERSRRIGTARLNAALEEAVAAHHPATHRGRFVQLKYATQVGVSPPVVAIFCNHPQAVTESYARYLANRFREAFGFSGVPLKLVFRRKSKRETAP